MPDWSYLTVFQPVLFQLPFETARRLALGSLGRLASLPGGTTVIDLMGHMAPDDRLATDIAGDSLRSPLVLGCRVDPNQTASRAFSRFGFGLIEVGPVTITDRSEPVRMWIDPRKQELHLPATPSELSLEKAFHRVGRANLPRQQVLVRMQPPQADRADTIAKVCRTILTRMSPFAANFSVPISIHDDTELMKCVIHQLLPLVHQHRSSLFVRIDAVEDQKQSLELARALASEGIAGLQIESGRDSEAGERVYGPECLQLTLGLVRKLRSEIPPEVPIIAGGGVHEPIDAVRLIDVGSTLVQLDSGLIFSGPGLPKRCHDALLCRRMQATAPTSQTSRHTGRQAWLWTLLLGASMLIGGAMAMTIAVTRVVMPYDEQFVGMTRSELVTLNERLLSFMTHDRVTLAGTMLSLGTLYSVLSWWGIRRGWHWAYIAVIASSFVGFLTFFAFLGFGYFDPLHAFVTAILFQFLLLGIHSEKPIPAYQDVPNLSNHSAWRRSQWGQLLWIVHGAILIVAGGVICTYGMTSVFVPEDLEFMQTTAEALCIANPQLVPLVAHDRATFGGMLVAIGVTVLLVSLWGFRQGNAWLWWTLLIAGNIAYISTILVHWIVGYTSLWHLLPAYGGFALLWIAAGLSRRWLCVIDPTDRKLWESVDRRTLAQ
ncbi:MAG: hypothetical protein R3B91_17560 [Planctomycetaceae bacterium]